MKARRNHKPLPVIPLAILWVVSTLLFYPVICNSLPEPVKQKIPAVLMRHKR